MDFLDSTVNNCSFASGCSVSLNSSLCCSPTTTAIVAAVTPTTTTMAKANRSRSRFAPSSASVMSAKNHRDGYQSPMYSPSGDRFISYSDQFIHEEGSKAVDIFPSPSCGWGRGGPKMQADFGSQQRRSLTFSPTRSDMAASLALCSPLYRGGGGAELEDDEGDDDYLSNTARSIFNYDDCGSVTSPQGAGRASIGDVAAPVVYSSSSFLNSSSHHRQLHHCNLSVPQNPLLDVYALEASHQEWSSAAAAAVSSTTRGSATGAASSGPASTTPSVSSPLMAGPTPRSTTSASSRIGGRQQGDDAASRRDDFTTASDYIRAAEEAASSSGSPHHRATANISSPGANAALALRSLVSEEGPEQYVSSLAGVLLKHPATASKRGAGHFVSSQDLCVQSPVNPVKRSHFFGSSSSPSQCYPDENAMRPSQRLHQSQTSLFESSDALTYIRNKGRHFQTAGFRTIPQTPERILDAPELVDDFYLNLLDWSAKNVLTVALSNTCYLWNAANGSITQLMSTNAVDNVITAVAWHKAGDVLAIGLSSGEINIWNTKTEKCLHVTSSHTGRVCSLGWHGYLLASGSRDTTIVIHNLEGVVIEAEQTQNDTNNNSSTNTSNAILPRSSSSSFAFTGTGVVLQGHTQEVCGLAWSPDGTQLASGGNDNILCIWNVKKDTLEITLGWQFSEHTAAIKAIAWNPARSHCLVTGGGTADKTLRVWNTRTGERTHLVDTKSQVCGIVWNNDGTEFVSSHGFSDNQLTIWRFPTMKKLADLTGHTSRVLHLAKSPDGEMVVSAAGDETIRFWRCFAPPTGGTGAVTGAGGAMRRCNPSASAVVKGDEEDEDSRQQHASEVAAIVAAVQRDLTRQSRQSRVHHQLVPPPHFGTWKQQSPSTGGGGAVSPTTSGTSQQFQRLPARPNVMPMFMEDSVENNHEYTDPTVDSSSPTTIDGRTPAAALPSSLLPLSHAPPIHRGSSPLSISSVSSPVHGGVGGGVSVASFSNSNRSLSPIQPMTMSYDSSSFPITSSISVGGVSSCHHPTVQSHFCGGARQSHGGFLSSNHHSNTRQHHSTTTQRVTGDISVGNTLSTTTTSWDAPPLFIANFDNMHHSHYNSSGGSGDRVFLSGSLLGGFSAAHVGGGR